MHMYVQYRTILFVKATSFSEKFERFLFVYLTKQGEICPLLAKRWILPRKLSFLKAEKHCLSCNLMKEIEGEFMAQV